MNIYIASPFNRMSEAQTVAKRLAVAGFDVVSRWHSGPLKEGLPENALMDIEDLRTADALLMLTDRPSTTGAMHWEAGFMYASGKPIFIVGPRITIFDWLPGVTQESSLEDWARKMVP